MSNGVNTLEQEGYRAGNVWAATAAEHEQLQRLAIFRQCLDHSRTLSWRGFFDANRCCCYTPAELVAFEILGTDQGADRVQASAFWTGVLGDSAVLSAQQAFVRAFAEGAIDRVT